MGKIDSKSTLVSFVQDKKVKERRRNKDTFANWLNVLAAYHNRPDLKVAEDLRNLPRLSPKQREELESIAVNWVQPHIRTTAAHLQKARPILNVEPATTDESDVQAAKIGDRLIKAEWNNQEMPLRRIEKAIWTIALGTGIWHTYFDSTKGEKNHGVSVGEIVTETVNPFKIVFEPNRTDHTRCRWAILTERLPIDEIEDKYKNSFKQLNEGQELKLSGGKEDLNESTDIEFDAYLRVVGLGESDIEDDGDWVDVDTFYHFPTSRYPQGLYGIVAQGQVLYIGPYPYPFLNRLPFLVFKDIPAPWRFYGESSTTHVLRAQEHYIMLRKLERKYLRNFGNGKWLLPKGLKLNPKKLTSTDNPFVPYTSKDPRQKPEFVSGQNPPNSLDRSMERAKSEGQQASGVNEVSHGVAPQGITAGRALLALQEMDATRLGLTVEMQEREYGRWGQNVLLMARHFYTEPRKFKLSGEALEGGMFFFEASDLGESHDVVCQPGSAMPQNRALKQETILTLLPTGILGDPQSPETLTRARRMLEFGLLEEIHDDDSLDEQKAELENQSIVKIAQKLASQLESRGILMEQIPPEHYQNLLMQVAPKPAELENHHVHIRNHVRAWKRKAMQQNKVTTKLLEAHLQMHWMMLNPQQPETAPPKDSELPAAEVAGQHPEQKVEKNDLELKRSDFEPRLRSAI